MKPFSLYLHIPFCLHKCPYCDFNTYALSSFPEREYVAALLSELDFRASLPEWKGRTIQTIYFGGGTPSLFAPASIRKIIATALKTFPLDDKIEISLEANPGTLSYDKLCGYYEAGVNRLSLGVQSFESSTLKSLGRIHTAEQTEEALQDARDAGIQNINVDLIYGAPGQTMESLQSDLICIGNLAPPHVSPYGLTIEKGTPFFTSYKKGILKLPKEKLVIEMMDRINNELNGCGLERYEISNFAKPSFEARHNMAYWNGDDYMGLGAGAHSFSSVRSRSDEVYGRRWSNFALPQKYIEETAAHGHAESWHERLGRKDAMFEYLFLGLRKVKGISINEFKAKFDQSIEETYPTVLDVLTDGSLVSLQSGMMALTEKGLMLADSVIENFSAPELVASSRRAVSTSMLESASNG